MAINGIDDASAASFSQEFSVEVGVDDKASTPDASTLAAEPTIVLGDSTELLTPSTESSPVPSFVGADPTISIAMLSQSLQATVAPPTVSPPAAAPPDVLANPVAIALGKGSETLSSSPTPAGPNPAQQFAANYVAANPLTSADQTSVSTARQEALAASALVSGPLQPKPKADPLEALINPSFGEGTQKLDPDSRMLKGGAANKTPQTLPPQSAVTPQTGLDAVNKTINGGKITNPGSGLTPQDTAGMDRAKDGFVVSNKAAANDGKAQLNAVKSLQQSQAQSDQISSNNVAYANNLRAAETAFNRALPDDKTKAEFKAAKDMAMPVNIPVGKPKTTTIPGSMPSSDDAMAVVKGTDNTYIPPKPFDPTGGALTGAATKPVTKGDWAGVVTQPLAGLGLGVFNILPSVVEGGKNAIVLAKNPPTSESVAAGAGSAVYTTTVGLPEQIGKNVALASGADPKMVDSISKQPSPNNISNDSDAQRVESVIGAAAQVIGAKKAVTKAVPIVTELAGQAKKAVTNAITPGAGSGTATSTATGTGAAKSVGLALRGARGVPDGEAQGYIGKGPTPASDGVSNAPFVQSPVAKQGQIDRIRGQVPVTVAQQNEAMTQFINYDTKTKMMPNSVEKLAGEAKAQIMASLTPETPIERALQGPDSGQLQTAATRFAERGYDRLSQPELASVQYWISGPYKDTKAAVTDPFGLTQTFSKAGPGDGTGARVVAQAAAVFDSALGKLPEKSGTFYKGIDLDAIERAKFVPGANIELTPYTAASAERPTSAFINKNARFVINKAVAKDLTDVNPLEREVMFPPNSRFKVVSVTETVTRQGKNLTVIEMEHVR
jgi:hypothetical protein